MKLILLGSGGYHPSDWRQTGCAILPEAGVILDAGTAMYRMPKHVVTDELDIFITHAHLDHVIGLTYLLDLFATCAMDRVTVHAEAAKLEAIDQHLFAERLFPIKPPFETRPLSGKVPVGFDGQVSYFPVTHPGGAVGYRIDWPDRSLGFVTDTTARTDADYVERIRGVDVLVHECYFDDTMPERAELTGHSCLTPVAQVAARAGVGRLVLVHVNPLIEGDSPFDLAVGHSIFPNIEFGHDNMTIEF